MAVLLWFLLPYAQDWDDGTTAMRALGLAMLILSGMAAFGLLAQITGAARLAEIRGMMRRAP